MEGRYLTFWLARSQLSLAGIIGYCTFLVMQMNMARHPMLPGADRRGANKPGALEQFAPVGIGRLRLHCIIGIGFLPVLLRQNAVQAEKVMPPAQEPAPRQPCAMAPDCVSASFIPREAKRSRRILCSGPVGEILRLRFAPRRMTGGGLRAG